MLDGWLRNRTFAPADLIVVEPHPTREALTHLPNVFGSVASIPEALLEPAPDAVLLGVRPEMTETVCAEVAARRQLRKALVLTVIAGKTFATYVDAFEQRSLRIVRCMPNTPCAIGKGVIGACPNANVRDADRMLTETMLRAIAEVVWVKTENELDALMAISGCGPAFVYYFVEALQDAGTALGLPRETAEKLARGLVSGAGAYAAASASSSMKDMIAQVANPGGPTYLGMEVYRKSDFKGVVLRASEAAYARALQEH